MGFGPVVVRRRSERKKVDADAGELGELLVEVLREFWMDAHSLVLVGVRVRELDLDEPGAQQEQPLALELFGVRLDVFLEDDSRGLPRWGRSTTSTSSPS